MNLNICVNYKTLVNPYRQNLIIKTLTNTNKKVFIKGKNVLIDNDMF